MFSQIKNETLNQCELWKPVSYVNLNRQTHNIVNDFLAQVSASPFDGLQWVHDHFAHRYLKNYIWWRRRENEKQLFNIYFALPPALTVVLCERSRLLLLEAVLALHGQLSGQMSSLSCFETRTWFVMDSV